MAAPIFAALRVVGMAKLSTLIMNALINSNKQEARGQWYVVSVVDYAVILEFGSMEMPARPHWRIAMERIAGEISLDDSEQADLINVMMVGGDLNRDMALRLVKRIRALIRSGGMVDTGNYLASIAMGKTEASAIAESEARLLDPSTSVLVTS